MRYTIWESKKDGQWYWNLIARNGEIVAASEGYSSKQMALKGIRATKKSLFARVVEV